MRIRNYFVILLLIIIPLYSPANEYSNQLVPPGGWGGHGSRLQLPECRKLIHMSIKSEFEHLQKRSITKKQIEDVQKLPKKSFDKVSLLRVQIVNNKIYTDYTDMRAVDHPKFIFEYLKIVENIIQ